MFKSQAKLSILIFSLLVCLVGSLSFGFLVANAQCEDLDLTDRDEVAKCETQIFSSLPNEGKNTPLKLYTDELCRFLENCEGGGELRREYFQATGTALLTDFLSSLLEFILWFTASFVVIMVAWHGFLYIRSGLTGNVAALSKSRDNLVNVGIGVLALLLATLIFSYVNPRIVSQPRFQGVTSVSSEDVRKAQDYQNRVNELGQEKLYHFTARKADAVEDAINDPEQYLSILKTYLQQEIERCEEGEWGNPLCSSALPHILSLVEDGELREAKEQAKIFDEGSNLWKNTPSRCFEVDRTFGRLNCSGPLARLERVNNDFKEASVARQYSANRQRGEDAQGSGAWGASRRTRDGEEYEHNGIDYEITPGERVFAPVSGTIIDTDDTFYREPTENQEKYKSVKIQRDDGTIAIVGYVDADTDLRDGQRIERGAVIGTAQDVSEIYEGITPHIDLRFNRNDEWVNPQTVLDEQNDS